MSPKAGPLSGAFNAETKAVQLGNFRDDVFSHLHERFGVCGHCGKRNCPGRSSNSLLPESIGLSGLIAAFDAAIEKATGEAA